MTREEASIIIGNIPVYGDKCYSIAEYQEAKAVAIQALLQEPKTDVLDKIRAEIDALKKQEIYKGRVSRDARISTNHLDRAVIYNDCLNIIDKYKERNNLCGNPC